MKTTIASKTVMNESNTTSKVLSSHTTSSGTRAIRVSNRYVFDRNGTYSFHKEVVILLNEKHEMIAVFPGYSNLSAPLTMSWNISGTKTEKYITGHLFHEFKYAQVEQARSGGLYYHSPLTNFLDEIANKGSEFRKLKLQAIEYENTIRKFREYGTDNDKQIARIITERKIKAAKKAKNAERLLKQKTKDVYEILTLKLRSGYGYVAAVRIYSNKGRNYHGETLEFRNAKPTTRKYFEIGKLKVDRMKTAVFLAKQYPNNI